MTCQDRNNKCLIDTLRCQSSISDRADSKTRSTSIIGRNLDLSLIEFCTLKKIIEQF